MKSLRPVLLVAVPVVGLGYNLWSDRDLAMIPFAVLALLIGGLVPFVAGAAVQAMLGTRTLPLYADIVVGAVFVAVLVISRSPLLHLDASRPYAPVIAAVMTAWATDLGAWTVRHYRGGHARRAAAEVATPSPEA